MTKKVLAFIFMIFIVATQTTTITATPRLQIAGHGRLENPFEYWEANGYPPNISFAWEISTLTLTSGEIVRLWDIGIVDACDASRQEIIDLLSTDIRIRFVDSPVTHQQRREIYSAIIEMNSPIIQSAGFSPDSYMIYVWVNNDYYEMHNEILYEKFGDLVHIIQWGREFQLPLGGGYGSIIPSLILLLCILFIVVCIIVIIYKRQKRLALFSAEIERLRQQQATDKTNQ